MELIKINSNNRPYYSDDFIKGFECGAKRQFEADKKARPKGEWKPYEAYLGKDREYSVTEHKCSLCGYLWGEPEYRYCPNCGADMRGGRADEHGRNKSADRQ